MFPFFLIKKRYSHAILDLHFHIDLLLIQYPAHEPAEHHYGQGKQEGTQVCTGMHKYILIKPVVKRGARTADVEKAGGRRGKPRDHAATACRCRGCTTA